jgi:KDO2-lipid IV(A) lauroyltransferase
LFKRLFNQTMAGYYLYRVLGFVVPRIPPRVGYPLFGWIGSLFFTLFADAREPLRANLRHVMRGASAKEIDAAARQTLRNHLKNYYDFFRATRLSDAEIKRMIEVHGLDNLQRALAKGKGVIFITAHFGNLDIVGKAFALNGQHVTIPAEHVKPEVLFQEIVKVRSSDTMKIIPVDGPLLALVRALKRKEIIGLASDLDITQSGIVVNFFDAPAQLPDGYAQLALKTGAPILPAFSLRRADNRFEAYAEPALELTNTGDFQKDVRVGVEQVVGVMEKWIGAHPDQWVMFHRIWDADRRG